MIKAVEEAGIKTARDFHELEILQTNQQSARKYANACYSRVKQLLFDDLTKMRPHYNIFASDGTSVINQENSEYSFSIHPIDGLANLSRAIADFTISIALNHHQDGKSEAISCVIYRVIGSDTYYSEKGFGSFLNNRKIKASNNSKHDQAMIICDHNKDSNLGQGSDLAYRNLGCKTLEIAYLAAGKIDRFIINDENAKNFEPFYLIAQQSGAKIESENNVTTIGN